MQTPLLHKALDPQGDGLHGSAAAVGYGFSTNYNSFCYFVV